MIKKDIFKILLAFVESNVFSILLVCFHIICFKKKKRWRFLSLGKDSLFLKMFVLSNEWIKNPFIFLWTSSLFMVILTLLTNWNVSN